MSESPKPSTSSDARPEPDYVILKIYRDMVEMASNMNDPVTKYYELRRSCCIEINITLCLRHFTERLQQGWKLSKDNGPDSQPCYDCVNQASATNGK